MSKYYVNKNSQSNGDHEVHKSSYEYLPKLENRIYLGKFITCSSAVKKAKEYYHQSNGCYYCSKPCHTQ